MQAPHFCCKRRPSDKSLADDVSPASEDKLRPGKIRILFVDDEESMLRVFKIGLGSMANVWDMEFAGSGEAALARIGLKAFDVVVTDMRMPGINGVQLLDHVLRQHPQTIRIILSGFADLSDAVNSASLAHQFLAKPCSLKELRECLERVTQVKARLINEKLNLFLPSLTKLPSLPRIYLEITEALQSPTVSADHIANIAAQDPALTAKLLQLSNSAFFGVNREVCSVSDAVQFLGAGIIQSLALTTPIFASFVSIKCPNFSIDATWSHSIQTAALSRWIFKSLLHDSLVTEQAFCAGILHDIGKIILAESLPAEYSAAINESRTTRTPLLEIEQKNFQATHAEVGAYLLALWGLPIPLVEAVACHHHPRRCGKDELCLAGGVHLANALHHSQSPQTDQITNSVDTAYLKHIKLDQQFETWRRELTGEAG